jgi:hypothetical protein
VRQYKNDFNPFPKDKLKAYLATLDDKPKNKVDEKEDNFLMSVSSLATGNTAYQPGITPNLDTPQLNLQPNLMRSDSPSLLNSQPPIKIVAPQPTIATQSVAQVVPSVKPMAPQLPSSGDQTKTMMPMPKGFNRAIGMPNVPDSPNLITGITRDARGNALSNILVEIKDKDGNPIRAFKTNELGRFASATPLANGTYTIEFEDPKAQNRFGKLAINITGQIILPIEAISIDAREELRMSLFSTSAQTN